MFDFTTTTFIHDAGMIEANPVTGSSKPSDKVLRLENKIFKYDDVVAIYRNPYLAPSPAKLYVDINSFMTAVAAHNVYGSAKRFKLDFYIKRSGDNNSFYSNDFVFKGKDFHYEWTNKQTTAAAVAKMINKIIRLYGDVYLKVYTESKDSTEWLVFESDNYAVFLDVKLKAYLPDSGDCCTFREGGWDILDELDGKPSGYCEVSDACEDAHIPYESSEDNEDYYDADAGLGGWLYVEQGVNGFGTYEQLLKDLRLPTMENFRWTSLNASEMPIPGNKYTLYTIHQISCRGVLGGSAVGEVTHSKTTHVFFVPTCGCETDLDAAVSTAITAAGMKDKLLTTTTKVEGKAIVDDPTHNPITVESFTHDPSIKADTVNIPVTGSTSESEGESTGN